MASILQKARHVGSVEMGAAGATFLPQASTCLTLGSLRHPEGGFHTAYDKPKDGYLTLPRLIQHCMLIGPPGVGKGIITKYIIKRFGKLQLYDNPAPTSRPRYIEGTSRVTLESITGGASEGVFSLPQLHDSNFIIAYELPAWLGSGPMMRKNVEFLKEILEDRRVAVNLVKMKGASAKKREEFYERCVEHGILFNMDSCALSYETNVAMLCATTPPEKGDMLKWLSDGYLSRFTIALWDPDEEEYRETKDRAFDAIPTERDLQVLADLDEFFTSLRHVRFKRVEPPPMALRSKYYDLVKVEFRRIADDTGHSARIIEPVRLKQEITQALTMYAVENTIRLMRRGGWNGRDDLTAPGLEYCEPDEDDFVAIWKPFLRGVDRFARSSADEQGGNVDGSLTALKQLIRRKRGAGTGTPETYQFVDGPALKQIIMEMCHCKERAAGSRIANLQASGYLDEFSRGRHNAVVYKASDSVVKGLGFETLSDRDRSETRLSEAGA